MTAFRSVGFATRGEKPWSVLVRPGFLSKDSRLPRWSVACSPVDELCGMTELYAGGDGPRDFYYPRPVALRGFRAHKRLPRKLQCT